MHYFSLPLACLLLLATLVYTPGLSGDFVFDDEANILLNEQLLITELTPSALKQAAYSMSSGPLMRPISYLTLALNHSFTGLAPLYFKLTNLLIHLLNGLAIFWLSGQLLKAYRRHHQPALTLRHTHWISLATSAFWLLHPLGLTSVLYIVQRMNSLSTLFVLLGLATYCWGRNRQDEGRPGALLLVASVLVFTPLAAFSKENGALLPFFLLIVEATLFRFAMPAPSAKRWLLIFFAVIAVAPAFTVFGYLLTHIDWLLGGYSGRDFTLSERLLTQARVVWFYLTMIVAPNISQLGLFHDDIPLSTGLLSPPTTGFAIAGLLGLLGIAGWAYRRAPLLSFGLLFFLVGHSMESSIFALEMVHEHRNYLPMFGILLPMAYYLLHPTLPEHTRKARIALSILFIAMLSITTAMRASDWGNPIQFSVTEARNHPDSARSQYRLGLTYWQLMEWQPENAEIYAAQAREHFELSRSANPNNSSGLFALLMFDAQTGNAVNPEQLHELETLLRSRPFLSNSAHHLRDINQCQTEDRCQFTAQQINGIFDAALANPTLRGTTRAKVLAEAMIVALVLGDIGRALVKGREAIQADPNDPQHRLNYSSVLIQTGQLGQARNMLQGLVDKGVKPFLHHRLVAQLQALATAEGKAGGPTQSHSTTTY
ncbi:MAG: tetratricopeptide repeat protein [Gammaproteobacteria bacterium]|nr:tetratricopeptide repeat protein [Gammaproteobacteria bacterium]